MNNRLKKVTNFRFTYSFLILPYERYCKILRVNCTLAKYVRFLCQMLHGIPISVVRVSRKSSTIFVLNLCKIQRHMFIYLGFTSQRSQRSVLYNLNQNFANSADLKGKVKWCAEYRMLAHFKYCF